MTRAKRTACARALRAQVAAAHSHPQEVDIAPPDGHQLSAFGRPHAPPADAEWMYRCVHAAVPFMFSSSEAVWFAASKRAELSHPTSAGAP